MDLSAIIAFVRKHPIGVGCGVLAFVLLVLTFTRRGSVATLESELVELQDRSSRLKNNLRYSADLEDHLATLNQAVEVLESKSINPGALATNLQFFYRLEQELGLTLVDIRQGIVAESREPREYLTVPYTISVEGTYMQILSLLQNLEEGGRIVQFVSANISPARGLESQRADPTDPLLVVTLDLALLGRS